ncbi:MAG: hypothetical protein J4473_02500 [Candidatus Aenigmarchaeota archaeon]|nr:hypothetical protein [Candidatus Aenigmarchaeota archaeon]
MFDLTGNYKKGLLVVEGHMYNVSISELVGPEIQNDTVVYRDDAGHKVCISLEEYLALREAHQDLDDVWNEPGKELRELWI